MAEENEIIAPEESEEKPRRGRPRRSTKAKIAEQAEQESAAPAAAEATAEEPPKRRRGRPRKNPLLEEQAADLGFDFLFLPHDLEDCRTIPRKEIRKAVNDYMMIVKGEEPLDATLVDFDDAEAW